MNARRLSFIGLLGGMLSGVTIVDAATGGQAAGQRVRVAAISFVPVKLDLAGNADRLEQAFRQAAAGGAKLAVAPEGALDGYAIIGFMNL